RFGVPFVKLYREEREMTVCIILDTSASMHTPGSSGSGNDYTLYEQGLLAAALIAFSAEKSGLRLCGIFFDNEIRRIFPARKGRTHTMAFVSAALENRPLGRGTGLGQALTAADRLLKRRSLIIVFSDFHTMNWEQEMDELSRQHDVIAVRIAGPLENEIPCRGFFTLEDPETGRTISSPSFAGFRSAWKSWHGERRQLWEATIRHSGAAFLNLSTTDDAAIVLAGFFKRKRGAGHD
ncbi:MAG: VWA domain-containing protein, partial [Treponema sp.]|nr:VWA domain-containing protein [Treponema sp.]